MDRLRRLAVILVFSLILVACSGGQAPEAEAESQSGGPAGNADYPYMGVAELDAYLAENAGKPTMVLFWTTWCPSCKQEIPEMEKLAKTYGDKLNVIAVSLDEKVELLEEFFKADKLDMPVYIGDNALASKFNISAIPTLVIFNRQGKLTFNQAGVFPYAMLKAKADILIGK